VAALIERTAGEPVSHTTIWKLQNGQAELLALIRDTHISSTQLRVILELSPEARRAIINLIIALTEQGQAPRLGEQVEVLTVRSRHWRSDPWSSQGRDRPTRLGATVVGSTSSTHVILGLPSVTRRSS